MPKSLIMKPFERWEREELELTFGLQEVPKHAALTHWLAADELIMPEEAQKLELFRAELCKEISYWNEEELKIFFINDVIRLVNFKKDGIYKTFAERTLSATVTDIHQKKVDLRGRVEMVVSTGKQKPRQPFFFIHEYKPLRSNANNDPEGQLLVAMLATYELNQPKYPMYGLYVQGKYWHFMILEGKNYSISRSYDATDEATLLQIVRILKRCKGYIETQLGLN
jgi:hypothetical protein